MIHFKTKIRAITCDLDEKVSLSFKGNPPDSPSGGYFGAPRKNILEAGREWHKFNNSISIALTALTQDLTVEITMPEGDNKEIEAIIIFSRD